MKIIPTAAAEPSSVRQNFISIAGIAKSFPARRGLVEALGRVDLDIEQSEFVSIIGPSGCGKSTLLLLLAGLEQPTAGRISIGNRLVQDPVSDLGIVFQQDLLLDWRTAIENVVIQAEIRGLPRKPAVEQARRLLAMVGLEGFEGAYPYQLSGGMRQRVSICRALLHNPPLVIMDEPFGALDALTRDQMQLDLLRLWSHNRMTVVFVTHSISEAVFLSDRVVVMSPRPGRIETIMSIDLTRPRRLSIRDTAEFIHYNHQLIAIFKKLGVLREDE